MLRLLFSCLLFLLVTGTIRSQPPAQDLTQDEAFFRQQMTTYQKWLNNSGLGQYLQVHDIWVREDSLSLYLKFAREDLDFAINAWEHMKTDFEAESTLTLEEQLFYKASFLMEVEQSNIDVQIYNTYDLHKLALFERAIYFEDGVVKIFEDNPKAKRVTINLHPIHQSTAKEEHTTFFRQKYTKSTVYNAILAYAKSRYITTDCYDRYPEVDLLENDKNLVFEVKDLCREVLTDEANPTLCGIMDALGRPCNWVKREMLRFTCTYEETLKGFRLVVLIDGKYGSGFYSNVKRGGYIDMEVDFDEYLEIYAQKFATSLRTQLQERP